MGQIINMSQLVHESDYYYEATGLWVRFLL